MKTQHHKRFRNYFYNDIGEKKVRIIIGITRNHQQYKSYLKIKLLEESNKEKKKLKAYFNIKKGEILHAGYFLKYKLNILLVIFNNCIGDNAIKSI